MKSRKPNIYLLFLAMILASLTQNSYAQIYSFEQADQLNGWSIDKGTLQLSDAKYKLGRKSLKIAWQPGAIITIDNPHGLNKATRATKGGINAWIYNETAIDSALSFRFLDAGNQEVCRVSFSLNFTGWRCLWSQFIEDMGKPRQAIIDRIQIHMPHHISSGNTYLDFIEFTPNVSWQKMSDAQYHINQKDYSLIPDFIGYRRTSPYVATIIRANDHQTASIEKRLTDWYLGNGTRSNHEWVELRKSSEQAYIRKGIAESGYIHPAYDKTGTPIGSTLFAMHAPSTIEGESVKRFRDINEKVFIPLALDYRKNQNQTSLKKALYTYDWFNDQGWADGSGLGTLCFEKLRSSGYFHSFFLLKDHLSPQQLQRELNTLRWFTLFGVCYQAPASPGEVADNLRALALPKLIYALSLPNLEERNVALTAFRDYMNNALDIAPGFFGTIKPDFSGYHHRGPYHSAYYPHALYAGALVAYLLHDTPYALSDATMNNLKQGLLTFRFFCANLDSPAGTVGRFPTKQQILETLLPAYAYVALSYQKPDAELTAAFKQITHHPANKEAIINYLSDVHSNLTYTGSVGEAELMARLQETPIAPETAPTGSLFMPYSGMLIVKNKTHHFNIKGFSRYIWDFESSASENLKGRYLAYGQIESFNLHNGTKSFNPSQSNFNWNYLSGATTKVLPDTLLQDKGGSSSGHRNFSDETFLSGVHASSRHSLFSFRMHDNTYDESLRANKSVFVFDDVLLCLGSDIANTDQVHPTVTTLYQSVSLPKPKKQEKLHSGTLLSDGSFWYAVKEGRVETKYNNTFTTSFINHATAPSGARYHYYMLPVQNRKAAQHLLSSGSPIQIVKQDNDAHIARHNDHNVVYAALFNAAIHYPELMVKQVNIPLSYILEQQDAQHYRLSLCEPDMRRSSRKHMGLLTESDVIEQEKPFNTTLILNGCYTATCPQKGIVVSVDKEKNETTLTIATIRGENYSLYLTRLN